MARDHDIYKIIDSVIELFPTCRVCQSSQIGLTPEIWNFWLPEYKNSEFTVLVNGDECSIAISVREFAEIKMNKRYKKPRHKEIVRGETPEEIALIICDYFMKVQSEENE